MASPPRGSLLPVYPLITQGDHFYGPRWSFFVDKVFIGGLLDAQELGMLEPGQGEHAAMIHATDRLNMAVDEWYDYNDGDTQMLLLRKRHRVFGSILQTQEVQYERPTNYMYYPPGVFSSISEVEPFAQAYRLFDDPLWSELQQLFGEVTVQQPRRAPSIVYISDDTAAPAVRSRARTAAARRRDVPRVDLVTLENTVHLPVDGGQHYPREDADRRSSDSVNQRALSPESASTSRISGTHSPKPLRRVLRHFGPSSCRGSNDH